MVPISVTLGDLERPNGRHSVLFHAKQQLLELPTAWNSLKLLLVREM